MDLEIEKQIKGVKDQIYRLQQNHQNGYQFTENSTEITEISFASSDGKPLDNSELNPLTLSMFQSPIHKSSSDSSLDFNNDQEIGGNPFTASVVKIDNDISLTSNSNSKNHKTNDLAQSDSDSELQRLLISPQPLSNHLSHPLQSISDNQESDNSSSENIKHTFSDSKIDSSNSSDSSSISDDEFQTQHNLSNHIEKQKEIERTLQMISDDSSYSSSDDDCNLDRNEIRKKEISRAQTLIQNVSDESSDSGDIRIQHSNQNHLDPKAFREREIEKAKKMILKDFTQISSDSDSDIEKLELETLAKKVEMEKSMQTGSNITCEPESIEVNPNRNIDDTSSSDSDDMPQFIPPIPDEIEVDLDFSKFTKKSTIVYNPNLSLIDTLKDMNNNNQSEMILYKPNFDDISSEELNVLQIDDDSNDEIIMQRIIDQSTDDDDILRIVKDSNAKEMETLSTHKKLKNENDNIAQILDSHKKLLNNDTTMNNEKKNFALHEHNNSTLDLMNALMSGSEIDSDVNISDALADSDESDTSLRQSIAAIDPNN